MIEDVSLKLLTGKPIDIKIGKVYPLKINDIVEIGEKKYNQYLNTLLFDVDLLEIPKEILEEMNVDKFTTYHFLLLQSINDVEFRNQTIKAFECFLREKVIFHEDALFFYVLNNENIKAITLEAYEDFRKILIKQNFLKELEEEDELEFGNELARQWYLELKRKERMQPKPKNNVDLQSIVSAVMWKGRRSVDEILEMTIYQLYDGYYRLSIIDNCTNLSQGIYHGTVDKEKIKESDLNWAKIIRFNNI